MCVCDYEGPEFINIETRRARKPHQCNECRRMILPGEEYEHVRGKWEGNMDTFKTCGHCLAVRQAYEVYEDCACFAYGGLYEIIADSWHGYEPGWFRVCRAIVMAKRAKSVSPALAA